MKSIHITVNVINWALFIMTEMFRRLWIVLWLYLYYDIDQNIPEPLAVNIIFNCIFIYLYK